MHKNTVPGKDAPLDQTISRILTILDGIGLEISETNWRNPARNCWSVHLQARRFPYLYANGKGTCRNSCLASGLAEFLERLSTNFFFADYFFEGAGDRQGFSHYPDELWYYPDNPEDVFSCNRPASQILTDDLHNFYNPEGELLYRDLLDNNSGDNGRGICALPFYSFDTGQKVYFPVSLLNNLYVSNGMAAGNSPNEATAQALGEIVERYTKNMIIRQGVALPEIPGQYLDRYPGVCAIREALAKSGFSLRICDGSLGGQFPVICGLLTDFASGGAYAAFGASLRFETAVLRTLTELLQGRDLDRLGDFTQPSHHFSGVADSTNLESHFVNSEGLLSWRMFRDTPDYRFTPWDFSGSTGDEVKKLLSIIADHGFSVFRAEYPHYSFYSCRIIIPGMSEIYPVDELIYNNRNRGSALRGILLRLPALSPEELLQLAETVDSLDSPDHQLVSELIGVIFPAGSAWHTLRIGELKAMIFLALGRTGEARQWCEWCVFFGSLPEERSRFYRLLHTLLSFEANGESAVMYERNIRFFYSGKELDKAKRTVSRQENFPGLNFGGCWREISSEQNHLIDIYTEQKDVKKNLLK
jgi:ribosomal protein S12 methylthiotransferase accessory factor